LSTLSVLAYYKGTSWSGPVNFSISGPVTGSYSSVPLNLGSVPAGTYRITYKSGGPAGATLGSVIPDTTIVISKGRPGSFTLNYYAQAQSGNVVVNATLNGSAYTGDVNFNISGPFLNTRCRARILRRQRAPTRLHMREAGPPVRYSAAFHLL
jgi:hypothetical protein